MSSCMRRVSDFVVNSLPQLGLKTRIQDVTILFFIKKNGEIQDNYYLLVLNLIAISGHILLFTQLIQHSICTLYYVMMKWRRFYVKVQD